MAIDLLYLLGSFLLSAWIGWMCIPRIILVSKRRRIFDFSDIRKVHDGEIPRLGGISFLPAILTAFTLFGGLSLHGTGGMLGVADVRAILFFFTGLLIIYATGIWDDLSGLCWRHKFLFQFLAAVIVLWATPCWADLQGLFGLHQLPCWLACPLTLILFVAIINAINLIDGIDGLSAGLCSFIFLTLAGLFVYVGNYLWAILAASAVGAALVFFCYNVFGKRLKIFMGDGGALTLGYLAAFLCLNLFLQAQEQPQLTRLITPVSVLGIVFLPLFDMIRLFIVRLCAGCSPFSPDKNHIHHLFLELGYTHRQSTAILMGVQAGYMAGNLLASPYVNVNLLLAIDLAVAVGLIAWLKGRIRRKRTR